MPIQNFPEYIEIDNIVFRPQRAGDAQALYELIYSDEQTMRYLPSIRHTSIEQTQQLIEINQAARTWSSGRVITYLLEHKQTKLPAAILELRPHLTRVEIGFILVRQPHARRARAAILAGKKYLDWLLQQQGIYRLFATCAVGGKSTHLLEWLGFTQEGKLSHYEPLPNCGIEAQDSYIYGKTRAPTTADPAVTQAIDRLANIMMAPI